MWGEALRVWDGNAVKFSCHDYCTSINVIKFIEKKKKKRIPDFPDNQEC